MSEASQYGFVATLANTVPEIKTLLDRATQESWTTDRFVMEVASTSWWKNTNDQGRQWAVKLAGDPKTAETELNVGAEAIRSMAAQMGTNVPDYATAKDLFIQGKLYNRDENAVRQLVFERMRWGTDTNTAGGKFGQLLLGMRQAAYDYGYTAPDLDNQINIAASDVMAAGGMGDTTAWKQKMANYAQVAYAPYAEDIRGGKTVSDIAKPILEQVAQLLEQNPEALSLQDSLLKKALTTYNEQGKAWSLSEIQKMARQDPRWDTTRGAVNETAKLVNDLGQRMGFLGS